MLAALAALSVPAFGQVSGTWVNPYGGTWTDPANWNSNPLYPDGGGNAVIPYNNWGPQFIALPNATVSLSSISIEGPSAWSIGSSGTLAFAGPAMISVNGPQLQPAFVSPFGAASSVAKISTTAGLIKSGAGPLLASAFTTFSGGVTVNDGALVIGSNYPLPAAVGTLTLNGGTLRVADNSTILTMPITIGAGGGTLAAATAQISLSSNIRGSSTLTLESQVSDGLVQSASSDFSGMINARAALKLTGLGALKNVARIDLADLLQLNNTAGTVEPNRIADGATITMRGGTVSAQSDQAHLITETLGAVALDRGLNTISGNQFMGLSLADLTRANRSVMSMGSISYTLQIAGAGPALSGSGAVFTPQVGIVPWARIDYFGIQPLTFDAGVLRPLSTGEVVGAIPSGTSTSNVKLTTDATLSSPATVNSLTLGLPSGNQTLAGTATLSVTSGAVFIATNQAATTTLATPLDFGSAEGIVHVNLGGGSTVNITGAISGSNGLTLAGTAALRGTSSYTGPTTVLGKLNLFDDVLPGQAGPLGTDTSSVVIDGSNAGITFYPIGGATIQFGRNIIASSFNSYGSVSLALGSFSGGAGTAVVSSDIQINGALNLLGSAKPGTGGYIFTGHLRGPGMLLNPNYVTLTGSSSFSGGVALNGGTIIVGDNNALGTGTLWFGNVDGSYLGAAAPTLTISNPIVVHRGMKTVGGFPITLSGPVDLYGSTRQINVSNNSTLTLSGDVFNGGINKVGGMLRMTSLNIPTLTVSSGVVRILPNGADSAVSRVQALTFSGATFSQLDLSDNDLIYDYSPGGLQNPITFIHNALVNQQLYSFTADHVHTALGYGDNSVLGLTSFDGKAVDSTSVLIKYTFAGDTNLDGTVDIRDLFALATHYNAAGNWLWTDGDVNYDGHVNVQDLTLLAINWQAGVGSPLGSILSSLGLPTSIEPEPGVLSLGLLIPMLERRRRRRF